MRLTIYITVIAAGVAVVCCFTEMCIYKGQVFKQGQHWQDGCDYNCVCEDGITGKYICTERCPTYHNGFCHLVQDPYDPCCMIPDCHSPQNVCLYKGKQYTQGQRWQDGCDYDCICEDDMTGKYKCTERCKTYGVLPKGCHLVRDFRNPCCRVPDCQPNFTPVPENDCQDRLTNCDYYSSACSSKGPLVTWVQMYCPRYCNMCPRLSTTAAAPSTSTYDNMHDGYCYFDGKEYAQGETWQDGCRYNCTCVSGTKGYYTCIPACPDLLAPTLMPSSCFYKQYGCCKRLVCQVPNNGTTDLVPYEDMTTPATSIPTTSPKPCKDVLHNCDSYPYACTDDVHIRLWATQYCRHYCDLC